MFQDGSIYSCIDLPQCQLQRSPVLRPLYSTERQLCKLRESLRTAYVALAMGFDVFKKSRTNNCTDRSCETTRE